MKEYSTILEPETWLSKKASIHARRWMIMALVMTDFASLALAFSLAVLLRILILGWTTLNHFYSLWLVLGLIILAFAWRGLYSTVGLNPADELRQTTSTITLVFLMLLAVTFLFQTIETYSRLLFDSCVAFIPGICSGKPLVSTDCWSIQLGRTGSCHRRGAQHSAYY